MRQAERRRRRKAHRWREQARLDQREKSVWGVSLLREAYFRWKLAKELADLLRSRRWG